MNWKLILCSAMLVAISGCTKCSSDVPPMEEPPAPDEMMMEQDGGAMEDPMTDESATEAMPDDETGTDEGQ